jgi:hypothetical protein
MAVYRQQRRVDSRLVLVVTTIVIVAIVMLLVIASRGSSSPVDPMNNARAKALDAAQGLDILTIEYPQASEGAELSGVRGALARAKSAFDAAKDDLIKVNSAEVEQIAADFSLLETKVNAKAPADEVLALANKLRVALIVLSKPDNPAN